MPLGLPRFLIFGTLTRDFILLPSGESFLDVPGGSALYAGVGLRIWTDNPPPAILAKVGEDYPQQWLDEFQKQGLDIRGVQILPEALDVRSFYFFNDSFGWDREDPVVHFGRLGLPLPKALLGYRSPMPEAASRNCIPRTSIRLTDIPPNFLNANAAHLCPLDFLSHNLLPAALRQAAITTITLDPSAVYMNPHAWGETISLLPGLTAFLPAKEEVQSLFKGQSSDLWEMASALASYGCEFIVIKCGKEGQLLYEAASRRRWEIPSYPGRVINLIGTGDAFCGGFLAGYQLTYDPLQAVLYGNISASLVIEGHSATYALDVLPRLPAARLEALRQAVRRV